MIRKGKNGLRNRQRKISAEKARKARNQRRYRALKRLRKMAPNLVPALAVVGTYEELIRALVNHRRELGLTHLQVDDLAGFQDGYTSKIEMGPKKKHGRGLGRLSLPYLLDTYGLRLAVVERRA